LTKICVSGRKDSSQTSTLFLESQYFTDIGLSSVKTVADIHRFAVSRSKHCWRAFRRYQHRWLL